MCPVPLGKTLCGALTLAFIAAGAACQQRAVNVESLSNAINARTTPTITTTNTNVRSGMSPHLSERISRESLNKTVVDEAVAETLANAIAAAKAGLKTLEVEWRLEELSGVHGGFIPQRSVVVKIHERTVDP